MHLLRSPSSPLTPTRFFRLFLLGFQSALIWIVIICIVLALVLVCCAICGVFRVTPLFLCTAQKRRRLTLQASPPSHGPAQARAAPRSRWRTCFTTLCGLLPNARGPARERERVERASAPRELRGKRAAKEGREGARKNRREGRRSSLSQQVVQSASARSSADPRGVVQKSPRLNSLT